METKITRLRNLMTPVSNYIELLRNKDKVTKSSLKGFNDIVEHELNMINKNIDEIREILNVIPDDACDPINSKIADALNSYNNFLLKNGYCDTDIICEEPTALDQFLILDK